MYLLQVLVVRQKQATSLQHVLSWHIGERIATRKYQNQYFKPGAFLFFILVIHFKFVQS